MSTVKRSVTSRMVSTAMILTTMLLTVACGGHGGAAREDRADGAALSACRALLPLAPPNSAALTRRQQAAARAVDDARFAARLSNRYAQFPQVISAYARTLDDWLPGTQVGVGSTQDQLQGNGDMIDFSSTVEPVAGQCRIAAAGTGFAHAFVVSTQFPSDGAAGTSSTSASLPTRGPGSLDADTACRGFVAITTRPGATGGEEVAADARRAAIANSAFRPLLDAIRAWQQAGYPTSSADPTVERGTALCG